MKHKVNAATPRLSDEDLDPIEQDDSEKIAMHVVEGWLPWDPEDVQDIRRLILEKLPPAQQYVIECFLEGLSHNEANVSEKHWRYHFNKGIEFIKKELKV